MYPALTLGYIIRKFKDFSRKCGKVVFFNFLYYIILPDGSKQNYMQFYQ